MKKLLNLTILSLATILSLTSCGKQEESATATPSPSVTEDTNTVVEDSESESTVLDDSSTAEEVALIDEFTGTWYAFSNTGKLKANSYFICSKKHVLSMPGIKYSFDEEQSSDSLLVFDNAEGEPVVSIMKANESFMYSFFDGSDNGYLSSETYSAPAGQSYQGVYTLETGSTMHLYNDLLIVDGVEYGFYGVYSDAVGFYSYVDGEGSYYHFYVDAETGLANSVQINVGEIEDTLFNVTYSAPLLDRSLSGTYYLQHDNARVLEDRVEFSINNLEQKVTFNSKEYALEENDNGTFVFKNEEDENEFTVTSFETYVSGIDAVLDSNVVELDASDWAFVEYGEDSYGFASKVNYDATAAGFVKSVTAFEDAFAMSAALVSFPFTKDVTVTITEDSMTWAQDNVTYNNITGFVAATEYSSEVYYFADETGKVVEDQSVVTEENYADYYVAQIEEVTGNFSKSFDYSYTTLRYLEDAGTYYFYLYVVYEDAQGNMAAIRDWSALGYNSLYYIFYDAVAYGGAYK